MDQEARLNATRAGIAPFGAAMAPDRHYLLTLGWLRMAGQVNTRAETFIPESPDFILSRPDYYAFFTYSLFSGRVAG